MARWTERDGACSYEGTNYDRTPRKFISSEARNVLLRIARTVSKFPLERRATKIFASIRISTCPGETTKSADAKNEGKGILGFSLGKSFGVLTNPSIAASRYRARLFNSFYINPRNKSIRNYPYTLCVLPLVFRRGHFPVVYVRNSETKSTISRMINIFLSRNFPTVFRRASLLRLANVRRAKEIR